MPLASKYSIEGNRLQKLGKRRFNLAKKLFLKNCLCGSRAWIARESAEEQSNHSEIDKALMVFRQFLVISAKPPRIFEPSKGALHHPAATPPARSSSRFLC